MFRPIFNFISYWYFRYLISTELYLVERWERHTFHGFVFLALLIVFSFNGLPTFNWPVPPLNPVSPEVVGSTFKI